MNKIKIKSLDQSINCNWFRIALISVIIVACSKDEISEIDEITDPVTELEEETFNYTSSANYNLNIIYFMPKDVEDLPNSHQRLSEIFLYGQNFYKKNMASYGFGEKTFNMKVDELKNRVKVTYIDAQFATSHYPYEGGGAIVKEEIESYFSSRQEQFESDHVIVILPVKDHDNPNVPFYGWGKWCFALDYTEMDIKYFGDGTKKGNDATKYIGGLMHELGHGLNLPHNKQKVSDEGKSDKGTALMGSGNYTYGSYPTFLTEASCAILNNNQLFNLSEDDYYNGAALEIENVTASFENGSLHVSGRFETDIAVNYVGFYNDPADDNADYDAVTWAKSVNNTNEFNVSMPINELHKKGETPYVLQLRFNHVNGEISTYSYAYDFIDNVPVITFGDKEYMDRSNWTISYFSSQENDGLAAWILDDDPKTFWHSRWKQNATSYPHTLVIDIGQEELVNGFSFLQRDGMRKIKDLEILISTDNENWTSMGEFQLKNINTYQHIDFTGPSNLRYVKVIAKSAIDGQQFAALAEVKSF